MEWYSKVINSMITLLNYSRILPTFKVLFLIEAKNEDIEDWYRKNTPLTDKNGQSYTDEEYKKKQQERIDFFHSSKYYNQIYGVSKVVMTAEFEPNSITFDIVKRIICGTDDSLPNGYTFLGDFKMANNSWDYNKKNAEVLECECYSDEHSYIIKYDAFDDDDRTVYINPHLSDCGLWHRLKYAIQYIFGHKSKYGCFDEILISAQNYQPLKNVVSYIESFTPEPELEKYKETLKNIVDKENKE